MNLIDNGRLGKYVLYGIGEVFLVVVGILIALQIDNWNEERKDQQLSIQYLEGIHSDLGKDIKLINQIVEDESRVVAIMYSIHDHFSHLYIADGALFSELIQPHSKDDMLYVFRRGTSFRGISATYDSLISDGKSGLIKNRELFGEIQLIYDEQHTRLDSIYESIKESESNIAWAYSYERFNWDYDQLAAAKEEKIFLDLASFTELRYLYCQWLILLRRDIETVLPKLQQEIDILKSN